MCLSRQNTSFVATNIFIATKLLSRQIFVATKLMFVATSLLLSRQKHIFIATKLLSRQIFVATKLMFVATSLLLSRQNVCRDKNDTCGSSRQMTLLVLLLLSSSSSPLPSATAAAPSASPCGFRRGFWGLVAIAATSAAAEQLHPAGAPNGEPGYGRRTKRRQGRPGGDRVTVSLWVGEAGGRWLWVGPGGGSGGVVGSVARGVGVVVHVAVVRQTPSAAEEIRRGSYT